MRCHFTGDIQGYKEVILGHYKSNDQLVDILIRPCPNMVEDVKKTNENMQQK